MRIYDVRNPAAAAPALENSSGWRDPRLAHYQKPQLRAGHAAFATRADAAPGRGTRRAEHESATRAAYPPEEAQRAKAASRQATCPSNGARLWKRSSTTSEMTYLAWGSCDAF